MNTLMTFLLLVLATASIAVIITKAEIWKGLRESIALRSRWLGKLISCTLCASVWVSLALNLICWPVEIKPGLQILSQVMAIRVVSLIIGTFGVVALAVPLAWLVYRAYKTLEPESPEVQLLRNALVRAKEKILEQQEELKSLNVS